MRRKRKEGVKKEGVYVKDERMPFKGK